MESMVIKHVKHEGSVIITLIGQSYVLQKISCKTLSAYLRIWTQSNKMKKKRLENNLKKEKL